jgi:hypothetical protein
MPSKRTKLSPVTRQVLEDLRNVEKTMREPIPTDWPFLKDESRFPPATMAGLRRRGMLKTNGRRLEIGL